jgi:hypothetical protein
MAGYGLYNAETFEGAFVFHGHAGAVPGGMTDMGYLPEYGRGYAIMINSGKGRALARISELVRHYIIRGLTPPALPPVAFVPAEVQRHYEGYYQEISPRMQLAYGLDRLLNMGWVGFTTNRVSVIGLRWAQLVPVTDRLFREKDQSLATLALLPDNDGKTLIQYGWWTFKKVSGWRVWGQLFAILAICLVMLSSPVFMLVRLGRKLLGKSRSAAPWSMRMTRLLSTLFLVAFWGLIFFNSQNLEALGTCSAVSVAIMLSSIAFALTAAASLYLVYRHRRTPMSRIVYWQAVLVAVTLSTIAAYMGYWGLIGLRLWA